MNYDDLIRNWHTKASEEDYFSKYVFEYLAFIAYLKKRKFPSSSNDRTAIQNMKQNEALKSTYKARIYADQGLRDAWENIRTELDRFKSDIASGSEDGVEEIKWWNCPHQDLQQQTEDEKRMTKGVIHSLDDWENMVECWYSISNNLFHGTKDPEDPRDKIVVKNGFITLRELVEIMLAE